MKREEIYHRARERVLVEGERLQMLLGWRRTSDPNLLRPLDSQPRNSGSVDAVGEMRVPGFELFPAGADMPRFYFDHSPASRMAVRDLIEREFPHWKERAAEEAEEISLHRIALLGHGVFDFGPAIDWNSDPITGRSWGKRFWADYDPVGDPFAGDPKLVFELNRHQHLPRLGKAYFLTGNEKFAGEAIRQMMSWIDQNPYSIGMPWQSSLEIALRAISWIWTLFFISPSPSLNEWSARRILQSLQEQLNHVYRYPSIYTSPNTHLIGEAAALFIAGLLFRGWNDAEAWRKLGATLLLQEIDRQVTEEGIHAELSSYYHCYAIDLYLQAFVLAHHNRFHFPEYAWKKLSRMFEFLFHLTRPDGSTPLLGDDDGGRALGLVRTDYHNFLDAFCTGAVLFRREDFKHRAGSFHEETLWLLGSGSLETYRSLKARAPSETRVAYPKAGYFIQRSGWGTKDSHLIFDCGRFGMQTGGHSHADALSFDFSAGGRPALIDPGTFVYNGAPEWRNYFRSTRAHNTAVVDGRDQSEPASPFQWKRKGQSTTIRRLVFPELEYLEIEQQGYQQLPGGVLHRRRLVYLPPARWGVLDDFRGKGRHAIDLYFHFPSNAELSSSAPGGAYFQAEYLVRIEDASFFHLVCATRPITTELIVGQTNPIQGWVSPRYGRKEAAPAIRVGYEGSTPASFLTLILPAKNYRDADGPVNRGFRRLALSGAEGIACALESDDRTDLLVLSTEDSRMATGRYRMQGEFFWMREEDGSVRNLLAVNARSFELGETCVFVNHEPVAHVSARFDRSGMELERADMKDKVYVRNLWDREFEYK